MAAYAMAGLAQPTQLASKHADNHLDCRARPTGGTRSGIIEIVASETDCTRDCVNFEIARISTRRPIKGRPTNSAIRRTRRDFPRPDPRHADVFRHPQPIHQLPGVMLDVANVDELIVELAHPVPREAAFGRVEVEAVDGRIDYLVANGPDIQGRRKPPSAARRK